MDIRAYKAAQLDTESIKLDIDTINIDETESIVRKINRLKRVRKRAAEELNVSKSRLHAHNMLMSMRPNVGDDEEGDILKQIIIEKQEIFKKSKSLQRW